jgi:hypothetical protein
MVVAAQLNSTVINRKPINRPMDKDFDLINTLNNPAGSPFSEYL